MIHELEPIASVREKLVRLGGCTEVEADALLSYAERYPAMGLRSEEAQRGIALAVLANPSVRESLLERALLPLEEQQREAAFDELKLRLIALNRFYPDPRAGADAVEIVREMLRALWPGAHDARINGALVLGFRDTRKAWTFDPRAAARAMRETEAADRAWQAGG